MRSYASRPSREEAELENLRARSNTHAAGASPGVEAAAAAAAAAFVGGLPRGAVRRGGPHRRPLRAENEIDLRPPVTRHWLHSSSRKKGVHSNFVLCSVLLVCFIPSTF